MIWLALFAVGIAIALVLSLARYFDLKEREPRD